MQLSLGGFPAAPLASAPTDRRGTVDQDMNVAADSSVAAESGRVTEPNLAGGAHVRSEPRMTAGAIIGTRACDMADPDATDHVDTEFWDACWTLEDEWLPRAVLRSRPRPPGRRAKQLPEVFALL
jgi:hypothetical protein